MKNVLYIDDEFWQELADLKNSPPFNGQVIRPFASLEDALLFLNKLEISSWPETIILDTHSFDPNNYLKQFNKEFGFENARALVAIYQSHGASLSRILFKSRNDEYVAPTMNRFIKEYPDISCAALRHSFLQWVLNDDMIYTPTPVMTKGILAEFLRAHRESQPGSFLRNALLLMSNMNRQGLCTRCDNTSNVKGISFQYGDGDARTCPVAFNADSAQQLFSPQKPGVLISERFPSYVLPDPNRYAGIIILNHVDYAGHTYTLCAPHQISTLAHPTGKYEWTEEGIRLTDSSGKNIAIHEGQIITIDPSIKTLFPTPLPVHGIEQALPHIQEAFGDLAFEIAAHQDNSDKKPPEFTVEVISEAHISSKGRNNRIGLTKTEQFVGPLVNHQAWEHFYDLLLGSGPPLRDFLSRRSDDQLSLPIVKMRHDAYQALLEPLGSLLSVTFMNCEPDDVIRLYDIPPEQFLDNQDLEKFFRLYGQTTRGVALAKQVPDLYKTQLKNLRGLYATRGYIPRILVPNPQTACDVHFARKLLQSEFPSTPAPVGAMIENIAACNNVEEITETADWLALGPNDLAADFFGLSRLDPKIQNHIHSLSRDFANLIKDTIRRARKIKPDIEVMLCGETAKNISSLLRLCNGDERIIDSVAVPPTLQSELLELTYGAITCKTAARPLTDIKNHPKVLRQQQGLGVL